jgi:hypothetical protein
MMSRMKTITGGAVDAFSSIDSHHLGSLHIEDQIEIHF